MDLDLLKIHGPATTALTAPLSKAAEEGRLVIQHREACGTVIFYPRNICPHCWSDRLVWRNASGKGCLKSFSVVHKPEHPGWLPTAPYVVVFVELDEGPSMLGFILEDSHSELKVSISVEMTPTRIGGRTMPAFKQEKS